MDSPPDGNCYEIEDMFPRQRDQKCDGRNWIRLIFSGARRRCS